MDHKQEKQGGRETTATPSHRKEPSSSGLLAKLPFMRPVPDIAGSTPNDDAGDDDDQQNNEHSGIAVPISTRSLAVVTQQQKTRRRRGSLRKVALLGRGAQRDQQDGNALMLDTSNPPIPRTAPSLPAGRGGMAEHDSLDPDLSDITPRPSIDARASQSTTSSISSNGVISPPDREAEPLNSYNSTTDEDDMLHIPHGSVPSRPGLSMSSGSESYFGSRGTPGRPRSLQQAKSPLSYSGLSKSQLPPPDSDWDYSETEWWGWVVLCVTWFVFVVGMGSCLDVWSWAWDVGKTPYAPPELEDDPTLPIVGYYPALMILTGVMAWVWVVVAWIGMKYFRHAKISGD